MTSLLMWLETAPRLAIQSAMEERSFEIELQHTFYVENAMEELQSTLAQEPLVESSFITQPALFLFNLNHRSPYFNILNHPPNESDFFISENLHDGIHFVEEEYLSHISSKVTTETGNDFSFSNGGIVISRRVLRRIEYYTGQSFEVGDTIDFGIATRLPDPDLGESSLYYFQMIKVYNRTINAIFDRIPQRLLLYPDFLPETLGDGIFIPKSTVNQSVLKDMERRIATTPHMFIRMDRSALANKGTFALESEIEAIAFRIERENVWFQVEVYTDEINLIISNYEKARIIILFLFIPLILVAFVFLLSTTSYMLNQRRDEIQLLRYKGASFLKILGLFFIEFLILAIIGFILGTLLGFINTWVISKSSKFLVLENTELNIEFINTIVRSWNTWILGGIFIGSIYLLTVIHRVRGLLHQQQQESFVKTRFLKIRGLSRRNIDVGILVISAILLIIVIFDVDIGILSISDIMNRLSLDPQLMGLYLATATIIWLALGYGFARLSGDILPRLSRLTQFIFQSKHKLITVSFARKRPQVLNIITLIVLTISLTVFSTFYSQTLEYNTQKNIDYLIGSDFKVFTEELTTAYASELEKIPGVSSAVSITQTFGTIGRYSITLVGVNPENYFTSCYWNQDSIVAGKDPNQTLNGLITDQYHGIIINDFLAHTLEIGVGDYIELSRLLGSIGELYNFTIYGVMKSAPGIGKMYSPTQEIRGFAKVGGIALIHQDLMDIFLVQTTRVFLVKTNETSSVERENVKGTLARQDFVRQVYDRESDHEILYDFMQISGVAGILSASFVCSLLVGIIGVSIFYNYIISDRLQEYAVLRAFGGTKNQIFSIAVSETIITVVFGISLGILLGGGYVIGFILITRAIILSQENIFELEMVASPFLIFFIVLVSFLALLISASLVASKARNVNTASLLRNL